MTVFFGLLLGLATSVIGWLLTWHALRPSIAVAPTIAIREGGSEPRLQTKIVNNRRWRGAIDVDVQCAVFVPNIYGEGAHGMIEIPLQGGRVLRLGRLRQSGDGKLIGDLPHRVVTINPIRTAADEEWRLSSEELELLRRPDGLAAFLEVRPEAYIQVLVSGSDDRTGSRRSFASPAIRSEQIVPGNFKPGPTTDLAPDDI